MVRTITVSRCKRNEYGDSGLKPGDALGWAAQAVDDGEQADEQQARTHENVADEEDENDNGQRVAPGEGDGVQAVREGTVWV